MLTLKSMSELISVSGYEEAIRNRIKCYIEKNNFQVQVEIDRIGNLIIHKKGEVSNSRIMIIAHMDEVGFQVMNVDNAGNAKVKTLGNIKTWNSINQKVSTWDGQKKGILYCEDPDGIKAQDFEKIVIMPTIGDFKIGDVLCFETELIDTETQYIGKALDNRASCYVLCELLGSETIGKNDIDFVFSVQEEIGMRGARVAISELIPDIIIDLDVSPVGAYNSLKMGEGVGIKLSDSIGVSSPNLVKKIEKIAQSQQIKYQYEVSDCGTSELIITNEKDVGAERIGLSIPCQNIHSPLTVINKHDLNACKLLVDAIIRFGIN